MASTNEILCNMINIQSVGNKTNIVRNLLIDQKLDILLLTETWLSNNTYIHILRLFPPIRGVANIKKKGGLLFLRH